MRALFVIAHLGFLRNFQRTIQQLLDAGHAVDVLPCKQHETIGEGDFEIVQERRGGFRIIAAPQLERQPQPAKRRFYRDIVHYCRPEFRSNDLYWERLQQSSKYLVEPETLQRARRHPALRFGWVRSAADAALAWREGLEPIEPSVLALLDEVRPHIVVVSPLVAFHAQELEYAKVARRRRIPTLFAVASWDNLVNKGVLKLHPDAVACWNDAMAAEAHHYHRVARRRIVITGSPIFDIWFDRRPSTDRATFLASRGLNPERPMILYVCSSESIAGKNEHRLISAWFGKLRSQSEHPGRDANVLVRPHPMNQVGWTDARLEGDDLVVWPSSPVHPSAEDTRRDFYDSLFHASAIIGLNTSAMIEAAILHRPVFCFALSEDEAGKGMDPLWRFDHQRKHPHFRHLLESGFVQHAAGFDTHFAQLRTAFAPDAEEDVARKARAFVARFIRPLGLTVDASSQLADRIIAMAASRSAAPGLEPASKQAMACSPD